MKKVTISRKPTGAKSRPSAEQWVQQQTPAMEAEPIKRLTIDIPKSLHTRVKSQCVLRGVNMVDVVSEFLEREFQLEPMSKQEYRNETPRGKAPASRNDRES